MARHPAARRGSTAADARPLGGQLAGQVRDWCWPGRPGAAATGCRAPARWPPTSASPASVTEQAYDQLRRRGLARGPARVRHVRRARRRAARAGTGRAGRARPRRPLVRLDAGTPWIDPRHAAGVAPGLARRLHRHARRAAYDDPRGLPELRAALADHLARTRGPGSATPTRSS